MITSFLTAFTLIASPMTSMLFEHAPENKPYVEIPIGYVCGSLEQFREALLAETPPLFEAEQATHPSGGDARLFLSEGGEYYVVIFAPAQRQIYCLVEGSAEPEGNDA